VTATGGKGKRANLAQSRLLVVQGGCLARRRDDTLAFSTKGQSGSSGACWHSARESVKAGVRPAHAVTAPSDELRQSGIDIGSIGSLPGS
jgi:hypothetical protein